MAEYLNSKIGIQHRPNVYIMCVVCCPVAYLKRGFFFFFFFL